MSHLDGLQSLGNGSDLIQLNQNGVSAPQSDSLLKALCIGNEQIVAHKLYLIAQFFGHILPAFPVLLIQTVLNGINGILLTKLLPVSHQLL